MGAARDATRAALDYTQQRMQFDKPLAGYQLTQQKLVDMALEIHKGILLALQPGRLKDAGTLQPHQISFGKLNNCREAIEICREARTMLGGNGITLDYSPLRHANNLESVRTYEGTDEVHTLIMGKPSPGSRRSAEALLPGTAPRPAHAARPSPLVGAFCSVLGTRISKVSRTTV